MKSMHKYEVYGNWRGQSVAAALSCLRSLRTLGYIEIKSIDMTTKGDVVYTISFLNEDAVTFLNVMEHMHFVHTPIYGTEYYRDEETPLSLPRDRYDFITSSVLTQYVPYKFRHMSSYDYLRYVELRTEDEAEDTSHGRMTEGKVCVFKGRYMEEPRPVSDRFVQGLAYSHNEIYGAQPIIFEGCWGGGDYERGWRTTMVYRKYFPEP